MPRSAGPPAGPPVALLDAPHDDARPPAEPRGAPRTVRARLAAAAVVAGLALLLGLLETGQVYIGFASRGRPIPWSEAVERTMPSWILLAFLTLPIAGLVHRFRIERPRLRAALAVHAFAALVFSALHLAAIAWIGELQNGNAAGFRDHFWRLATIYFMLDALTYAAIVGVMHGVLHYRAERARELAASRLLAHMAEARLLALRGQLEPDFFFNALNAIAALVVRGDGEAGVAALSSLGTLIRRSLDSDLTREITLAEELELLDGYLEIQHIRFGDRLRVAREAEGDALAALVPPLILQPLVDHALGHALAERRGHVRILVRARAAAGMLHVEVEDASPPGARFEPRRARTPASLEQARGRLQHFYGAGHRFECGRGSEGAWVRLAIPLRPAREGGRAAARAN